MRTHLGLVGLAAILAAPGVALGQDDGFDAHGFYAAAQDGDPRDLLQVERAGRFHAGEFYASGLFEYADRPLVLVSRFPDDRPDRISTVVDNLVALNLTAGIAVHDRLRVDLRAPLFISSIGDDGLSNGFSLGDMRVALMVGLIRPQLVEQGGGGLGLSLIPWVDLPTGRSDQFLGNSGFAGGGKVAATYEAGNLTVSADVGTQINPTLDVENLDGGPVLLAGLGVGYLLTKTIGVNIEANTAPPFTPNEQPGTGNRTELAGAVRGRVASEGVDGAFHWLAGGGMGLTQGAGTAAWRLFIGAGYGKIRGAGPKDRDKDGIIDPEDACPTEPEVVNNYKDTDGCPDALGTILLTVIVDGKPQAGVPVTITGLAQGEATSTGDKLSFADIMPGTKVEFSADWEGYKGATSLDVGEGQQSVVLNLTPYLPGTFAVRVVDEAGKLVPNASIRFQGPNAPEPRALADGTGSVEALVGAYRIVATPPEGSGLMQSTADAKIERPKQDVAVEIKLPKGEVTVTQREIKFEKIFFEVDKADLKPESLPVLDKVVGVLKANEDWIVKLEVGGHTDSDGSDEYNQELSQRRVETVVRYLESKGVRAGMLTPKGYGESQPIASNANAAGKAKNRRVEFRILERDEKKLKELGLEIKEE